MSSFSSPFRCRSGPTLRRWIFAVAWVAVEGGVAGCAQERGSAPDAADLATKQGPGLDERTQARVRMATTLLDEGQIAAAMEQLRRLPAEPEAQVTPSHTPAWFEPVLERLLRRRSLAEADSLLALTGPLGDRPPRLQALTASLQVLQGEVEAAVGTYAAIRTDDPALQLRVLHELASLELTRGEAEAALERAREGVALAPSHQALRLIAAQALRQLDRPHEALAELASMNPSPVRWVAEGELHLDVFDHPDTAVVLLSRAVRAVPQDLNFRQTLGRAWLEAGRAQRAVQVLEPLAAQRVPFGESQRLLARAHRELGRVVSADSLEAIVRTRELHARTKELRVEGLRLSFAGAHEAALATFEAAIALAPDDGDLHNDRGTTLANLQRWNEAEEAFVRAARLRPADPTPMENLARLHDRTGNVEARDRALAEAQTRRAAVADAPESPR